MKAPDEIYVTIDRPNERIEYNPELVGVAWSKKDKSCEHIEYIRKDMLLEWAEGKKKYYLDRQEYDCGWNDLLDELIDKLNLL